MKDQRAETIAKLLTQAFSKLRSSEYLHLDQSSNLESNLLKETCRAWGICKTNTSAYHPQGSSLVERSNRTLMLKCCVNDTWEWERSPH